MEQPAFSQGETVSGLRVRLALAVLVLVVFMAYSNSFKGPFILDDAANILENRTIRSFWPVWDVFSGPRGHALAGRPVINLSLAVNYAISGYEVWSYHAFNLLFHLLSALLLFGIVRRTLISPAVPARFKAASTPAALFCALFWAAHPLCTQAVTYVIQRCESLMGLFFLLVLYAAIRGWRQGASRWWQVLAGIAMIFGVGSKEVIVAAPLLVLCYDFIFVHGKGRGGRILKDGVVLYAGLVMGLVLLFFLVSRGAVAATVASDIDRLRWPYLVTQAGVIVHYLLLSFWPASLSMDYGWPFADLSRVWREGLLLAGLFCATLWGLVKRRPWAFPGVWFFLSLAPSSSLKPQLDPAFEYRMYLPLAAVAVAVVMASLWAGFRVFSKRPKAGFALLVSAFFLASSISCALAVATMRRNDVYASAERLWADTIKKSPESARAWFALATAYEASGRAGLAKKYYREAISRTPHDPKPYNNLGLLLLKEGKTDEAIALFKEALAVEPRFDRAYVNLGEALMQKGLGEEARRILEEGMRLAPDSAHARLNMGLSLMREKLVAEGEALCREALKMEPGLAEGRYNFALELMSLGRKAEGAEELKLAVASKPDFFEALVNLGAVLIEQGRLEEATGHLERAAGLKPDSPEAKFNLGNALASRGFWSQALPHYEKARRLMPRNALIRVNLGVTLANLGRKDEARKEFAEALDLEPQNRNIREIMEKVL